MCKVIVTGNYIETEHNSEHLNHDVTHKYNIDTSLTLLLPNETNNPSKHMTLNQRWI